VMAYIVNAFSHNLMDSVPLMWILAGFSIAVAKLAEANNGKRVPERVVEAPPAPLPDASSS